MVRLALAMKILNCSRFTAVGEAQTLRRAFFQSRTADLHSSLNHGGVMLYRFILVSGYSGRS